MSTGFLAPIRIEEIEGDDRHWRLLEPCFYHLKEPHGKEWVMADAGMVTDFGSIPRALWSIPGLSPMGKYRRAYVVHDELWRRPVIRKAFGVRACGFRESNDILREAMHVLSAPWFLRQIVWAAVSTAGRLQWNRYRQADTEKAEAA